MSFGVDVANIYELLDDENGEAPQKKAAPSKKEPTKKEVKAASKTPAPSTPSKSHSETSRKNEKPNAAGKENRERSVEKTDRRSRDTPKTEPQEAPFEKRNQVRRNKEKGEKNVERSANNERANGNRERPSFERDGNSRNKRAFDRRSGTGRGREIKRGGSGKANWGAVSEEVEVTQEEIPKTADTEKPEVQNQQEGEVSKEGQKEQDPDEKLKSLDEYYKLLEEKRAKLPLPEQRRAGEGVDQAEWANWVAYEKESEAGTDAGKKEKKAKDIAKEPPKKKMVVPVNEILRIDAPKRQRPPRDRDRESPNQRKRNNSGRNFSGKKGGPGNRAEPNFMADESSFPALSAKA